MIREICDICKKNDADKKFKIKRSVKGYRLGAGYLGYIWSPYEKIVICNECADKLFGVSSSNKSNLYGAPDPKEIIKIKQEIKHNE